MSYVVCVQNCLKLSQVPKSVQNSCCLVELQDPYRRDLVVSLIAKNGWSLPRVTKRRPQTLIQLAAQTPLQLDGDGSTKFVCFFVFLVFIIVFPYLYFCICQLGAQRLGWTPVQPDEDGWTSGLNGSVRPVKRCGNRVERVWNTQLHSKESGQEKWTLGSIPHLYPDISQGSLEPELKCQ